MIIRDATLEDIAAVLGDLSSINRKEMELYGWDNDQFVDKLMEYFEQGFAHVGIEDDRPQCFLILRPFNGAHATFFCATQEFFDKGAWSVREGRKYLKAIRDKYGPICTVSAMPHPDTARWFKALGYTEMNGPNDEKIFLFT